MRVGGKTRRWILAALASAALPAGCNQIIGLDPGGDKPTSSTGHTTSHGGAGGATTTSSGGGGAGACAEGQTRGCYSGAAGTEDKGICHGGTQTCVDGGFGGCVGEVLPLIEDCAALGDEDCDGVACSETRWAELFGDALNNQSITGIAVDGDRAVVVVGSVAGSFTIGNGVSSVAGADILVAKLASGDGGAAWGATFGGALTQSASGVAIDLHDQLLVTGTFSQAINWTTTNATVSAGGSDAFVAKLDGAGDLVWARSVGGAAAEHGNAVAATPEGDALVAGDFMGALDLGNGVSLGGSTASANGFLARVSGQDGGAQWAVPFGDSATTMTGVGTTALAVASDGAGNAYVAGTIAGNVTLGGAPYSLTPGLAAFFAAYGPSGALRYAKVFTTTASPFRISSVAVTPEGEAVIAGVVGEKTDFGRGSTKGQGIFAARFAADGACLWQATYGGSTSSSVVVALDGPGNVILAGGFAGNPNFGNAAGLTNTASATHGFVAKLGPAGQHLWSRAFGDPTTQSDAVLAVAVIPVSNEIVVAGRQRGVVDYGGGFVFDGGVPSDGGPGDDDLFIADLQP